MFLKRNSRSLSHQPVQAKFMMHIKANDGPHEGEKWAKSQETSKGYYIDKVVSLGNRDVFCEKVMDDDFGESGTGHLLLSFGTGLSAINLELEIFPYTSV
ncbi:hypothetical protein Tco_0910595 [Tanacetum coccineum]|uniref:Uncharacterized protein n=1 Tax=Tanacetum coccineum TaxID=301880 RepID=A0ABQ5CTE5_9ASTR